MTVQPACIHFGIEQAWKTASPNALKQPEQYIHEVTEAVFFLEIQPIISQVIQLYPKRSTKPSVACLKPHDAHDTDSELHTYVLCGIVGIVLGMPSL